jgi:nitrate/TMAO reductase-like tetraheme cytochrome c subunit
LRRPIRTITIGLLAGGMLTLGVLNLPAVSRALDSPSFCASCHVMSPLTPAAGTYWSS